MSTKSIAIAALAFALSTAVGSAQTQTKTFDFTNKPTQQGLQEVATILRTVGDIQQLSIDSAASNLTVTGTPDQIGMTGWIVGQLDQPVTAPPVATASPLQYLVAGKSDDVIRVFHLKTVPSSPAQPMQEMLTVLRTVADIQKIFNYTALSDMVVRGTAAQVGLAGYLIGSLDVAKDSVTTSPEFQFQNPRTGAAQVARVFFLKNVSTPRQVQEILTVLRTVVDVTKIFDFTPNNGIAILCSAGDLAASDWLIQSLDIPSAPAAANVREYTMTTPTPNGDNMIRVFYPAHMDTPKAIQETLTQLRTKLLVRKTFSYSNPTALVVRGSADLISKAEQLILSNDQVAKSTP